MFHLRLIGMIMSRTASFGALSDTARFGRTVSLPSRSSFGTRPEVETVIRRCASFAPLSSVRMRSDVMRLS
jgi:hypothetical protein